MKQNFSDSQLLPPPSILITGATGLIGAHIAYDLVKSGEHIRAIKRKDSTTKVTESIFNFYSKNAEALLKNIEWVNADLLDAGALEDALAGITHVYHAAALVSFVPSEKKNMLEINIEGTANLVNLCLEKKIEKFCHISSIAALGRTTDGSLIDENTWWKNSPENSWYAISKYGAEREVWRATEEGMNVVIVNPSLVIAPGTGKSSSELFRALRKGLRWYTDGVNGFVDVRDVSCAAIQLMKSNIVNERFIVSGANLTYREFFNKVLKQFGRKETKWKASRTLLGLGWRGEKIFTGLTGRAPRVTKETAQSSLEKNSYKADKITHKINFKYRNIEQSIKEICAFYQ
ncbi:MAG: NAD-dependent epimerase/dehydratase family protein [Bacteroidetes bacterium]|nr:NAD-dependent epimerase/dehydratase family protein [Bacteroidota bacterium]